MGVRRADTYFSCVWRHSEEKRSSWCLFKEAEKRREEVRLELKLMLVPNCRQSPTNARLAHGLESRSVSRRRSARVSAHTYAHTMEQRRIQDSFV